MEQRAVCGWLAQVFTHHVFALGIQGAGGLVQDENSGVTHERPGDGHPLLLAS